MRYLAQLDTIVGYTFQNGYYTTNDYIGNLPISVKYLKNAIIKRNISTSTIISNCERIETDAN